MIRSSEIIAVRGWKVVQWLRALDALPEDSSSVSGIHVATYNCHNSSSMDITPSSGLAIKLFMPLALEFQGYVILCGNNYIFKWSYCVYLHV